jgi:hypothetical protein
MRLRITEIHEHTVAHIFRYEPAKAAHGLGDAFLIGGNKNQISTWLSQDAASA